MKRKRRGKSRQKTSFRTTLLLTIFFVCMGIVVLSNLMPSPRRSSTATSGASQATVTPPMSLSTPMETVSIPSATIAASAATLNTDLTSQAIVATQGWFVQQQTQAVSGQAIDGIQGLVPINVGDVTMRTMYAQGSVNVRACPRRDCDRVNYLIDGQTVTVTGEAEGDAVQDRNSTWYRISYEGRDGFVYSAYLSDMAPSPVPATRVPFVPVATQSYSPQPAQVNYVCNGIDDLNCSDFAKDGISAQQHLLECGYDEDRLDADKDGRACEYGPY